MTDPLARWALGLVDGHPTLELRILLQIYAAKTALAQQLFDVAAADVRRAHRGDRLPFGLRYGPDRVGLLVHGASGLRQAGLVLTG
jgi:hypothetical protein